MRPQHLDRTTFDFVSLQPENEEKSIVYDNIGPNVCMGDHKVTQPHSLCAIVLWCVEYAALEKLWPVCLQCKTSVKNILLQFVQIFYFNTFILKFSSFLGLMWLINLNYLVDKILFIYK